MVTIWWHCCDTAGALPYVRKSITSSIANGLVTALKSWLLLLLIFPQESNELPSLYSQLRPLFPYSLGDRLGNGRPSIKNI